MLTFISLPTLGKQLLFTKKEHDTGYRFTYQWLDHKEITRDLSFDLSHEVLFQRFRSFRAYQEQLAEKSINKAIYLAWKKKPIEQAKLRLLKRQGEYQLTIKAQNDKAYSAATEQLMLLKQQAINDYLNKEYYQQFTTANGETAVKPNHAEIAKTMVEDFKILKPLILEQVDLQNIRTATNYVLGFVQSIPYATLESRVTSSGAGFNPPNKLLWENQGDCDSKVTLSAALLRALMPRVKIILIFIDGHALFGIETRPVTGDFTLEHEGETFVLAEPTGPSVLALGSVSIESEQAILNGMYSVDNFYKEDDDE